MSRQWGELAWRGGFGLLLLTPARAAADGWTLRPGSSLIAWIAPDGAEPVSIGFKDAARVAQWLEEAGPHTFEVVGVAGEDAEALRASINEMRLAGTAGLH